MASVVAGRLADVRVREGDRVTRGEILAVVGSGPQAAQARSAAAAVTAAEGAGATGGYRGSGSGGRPGQHGAAGGAGPRRRAPGRGERRPAGPDRREQRPDRPGEAAGGRAAAGDRPGRAGGQPEPDHPQSRGHRAEAGPVSVRPRASPRSASWTTRRPRSTWRTRRWRARASRPAWCAPAPGRDVRAGELRVEQAQEALPQARTTGQARASPRRRPRSPAGPAGRHSGGGASAGRARGARNGRPAPRRSGRRAGDRRLRGAALASLRDRRAPRAQSGRPGRPGHAAVLEVTDARALNLLANLSAEEGLKVRPGHERPRDDGGPAGPEHHGPGGDGRPGRPAVRTCWRSASAFQPDRATQGGHLRDGGDHPAHRSCRPSSCRNRQSSPGKARACSSRWAPMTSLIRRRSRWARSRTVGCRSSWGIAPGDTVIRLGQYELTDGAKVRARDPAASGA